MSASQAAYKVTKWKHQGYRRVDQGRVCNVNSASVSNDCKLCPGKTSTPKVRQ